VSSSDDDEEIIVEATDGGLVARLEGNPDAYLYSDHPADLNP
jgi:hypothetical protein